MLVIQIVIIPKIWHINVINPMVVNIIGVLLTVVDFNIHGTYTIAIKDGANVYQYLDYSIMPIINYKSALIILNYLCKCQNWKLIFKYYNQYYISSGCNKVPQSTSEKYIITNLVKDLNTNNIYSIIKKERICNSGTSSSFSIYYYNSTFNTSTVTDVINQKDFVIEISK